MKTSRFVAFAASAALAAAGATCVAGGVLVSNLAEPLRAATDVGNNPNPTPPPSGATEWSWAAQSFTTDGSTYSLERIDMIVGDAAGTPVVVAELREDNAGTIGDLITTLIVPDITGPLTAQSLVPSVPVSLAPGTTYWVVLGVEAPGDGVFFLAYANTNDSVGAGVVGQYADSQDSGGTWFYGALFPYYIQVVANVAKGPCVGDLNGDGMVNSADLAILLGSWGPCAP